MNSNASSSSSVVALLAAATMLFSAFLASLANWSEMAVKRMSSDFRIVRVAFFFGVVVAVISSSFLVPCLSRLCFGGGLPLTLGKRTGQARSSSRVDVTVKRCRTGDYHFLRRLRMVVSKNAIDRAREHRDGPPLTSRMPSSIGWQFRFRLSRVSSRPYPFLRMYMRYGGSVVRPDYRFQRAASAAAASSAAASSASLSCQEQGHRHRAPFLEDVIPMSLIILRRLMSSTCFRISENCLSGDGR